MTVNITQAHQQWRYSINNTSLPIRLSVVSVLHCFRDVTFTVYVTVCDLDKAFVFNTAVKIIDHVTV